jgi:hypothetical protein
MKIIRGLVRELDASSRLIQCAATDSSQAVGTRLCLSGIVAGFSGAARGCEAMAEKEAARK